MKNIISYIYVIELIFFSGSVRFSIANGGVSMIVFILTACLLALFEQKPLKGYNVKVMLAIVAWIIFVQFIETTSNFGRAYLSYILYPLGCCIGLSQLSFEEFRNKALNVFSILCLCSIVVQLGFDFFHLASNNFTVPDGRSFTMCFGIFNVAWGSWEGIFRRMSSIYWEPGQFQIVCFYILCLFTDKLSSFTNIKSLDKRFIPIFLGILYSQSTMGYMVLAFYLAMVVVFRKQSSGNALKSYIIKTILICVGFISIYALSQSDVIQDKFAQKDEVGDTSYSVRMLDNIACLTATLESPIVGWGIDSNNLRSKLLSYGSHTSSNGWLLASASLGIPYILFIFIFMYVRLRGFDTSVPRILILLILILAQCNEAAIFFPYIYMYLFKNGRPTRLIKKQ